MREVLRRYGADRTDWVKGSLMLLDVNATKGMHDNQYITTDSVMNRTIDRNRIQIADSAYFMYMGRIDMTDHIKARLRHFRAATKRDKLADFLNNEVPLPDEATIDRIAEDIRQTVPRGDYYAMLYLARCAVRSMVNGICLDVVLDQWDETKLSGPDSIGMDTVTTYANANRAVSRFFIDVDWSDICGFAIGSPSITQERLRTPFDLAPHLTNKHLANVVFSSLGITNPLNKEYYLESLVTLQTPVCL